MAAKNIVVGLDDDAYLTTYDGHHVDFMDSEGNLSESFKLWLNRLEPFTYEPIDWHLSKIGVRPEKRNGKTYWYAYRRVKGRLKKQYLGQDQALTLAKLENAAKTLFLNEEKPQRRKLPKKLPKNAIAVSAVGDIARELMQDQALTRNGKDSGAVKRALNALLDRVNGLLDDES